MNQDVIFEQLVGKNGDLGCITLNRVPALNALTHAMCLQITEKLQAWQQDPAIKAVIIQGAGEKAFCAGGDIRALYDLGKKQEYATAMQFFIDEYKLNLLIANYTKPYFSLMDGITMGGGLGLSVHGRYRLGTERLLLAMPETGIGFFPDIGGSYFLPRCKNETGLYLGLTGERIEASDALYAGLIDYVLPSVHLPDLLKALKELDFDREATKNIEALLVQFHVAVEPGPLQLHGHLIQTHFSVNSIEALIQHLRKIDSPWAEATLERLLSKSPLSLKITLEALRRGLSMDLAHCLQMETILCSHFLRDQDFYEGVRALLIDKDKNPQWQPASLDRVSNEQVESYFVASSKARD